MSTPAPLKWHGGKEYLASKIIALMPPHLHYVETHAGGLAVLRAKPDSLMEGVSEVVNDLSQDLSNFWRVLQNEVDFAEFRRLAEATPFSQIQWDWAKQELATPETFDDPPFRAWQFFILCRQSLAGRMRSFAPLSRTRTRRGMNEQVSAWLTAVEGLPEVHARLKRVVILQQDAVEVIRGQDGPDTLFYVDPPYLSQTRTAPDVYRHEMTDEQHGALLATLLEVKGKVLLSGYESPLYERMLAQWRCEKFYVSNHAAHAQNEDAAKRVMTECVWMNYRI